MAKIKSSGSHNKNPPPPGGALPPPPCHKNEVIALSIILPQALNLPNYQTIPDSRSFITCLQVKGSPLVLFLAQGPKAKGQKPFANCQLLFAALNTHAFPRKQNSQT